MPPNAEPEVADAVADERGAGIGERQVDVHAVDALVVGEVTGRVHRGEEVVADGERGHDQVVVVLAVLVVHVAGRRERRRPRAGRRASRSGPRW